MMSITNNKLFIFFLKFIKGNKNILYIYIISMFLNIFSIEGTLDVFSSSKNYRIQKI